MSGLKDFLTPYSHLLFANRNPVIVLLAVVLGWTAIQLLVARWRTERLERDLRAAQASQSTSPLTRPRHAPAQLAEEPAAEGGALPPIKGGRSYARNLGSALQKAGIPTAGPQLYSPPVPQGWNANTGNGQPGSAQPPMQPPTYAQPPAPWGAPPAQPAAPWAYPAGANRPQFPAQPMGPAPSPYAPQAPAPFGANQGQPQPPAYPAPSPFGQPFAPNAESPVGARPSNDASALAALPSQAMPASAAQPPQMQPVAPPVSDADAEESDSKDSRRRGKPKRRRFNLSVLDNLERIVQPKAAEQAPVASRAPAVSLTPIAQTAPAPPAVLETPTLFEQPSLQVEPASEAPVEMAESVETTEPEATTVEAEAAAAEPEAPSTESETAAAQPEAPVVLESPRSPRPDMRSMLFGEEPQQLPFEERPSNSPWEPAESSDPWKQAQPVVELAPEWEPVAEPETAPEAEAQIESPVEAQAEGSAEVLDAEPTETAPVEAVEPSAQQPAAESGPGSGGAGSVVIIEDDKAAADYYATLFRGNGYQVDVANDGVSGVDLCTRLQPQVILLDVMMPRQNGILVLQTLRASDETRNTPVVVMSNFSEPTLIKRALQLGALEYVIKTQVEGPALLTAIPRWINREKAFAA